VNHPVVGELHLHRDKLPVDDVLLVLYYADQGSEIDEKLRLLASMAQPPRVTDHERLNWAGTSNGTETAERQQMSDPGIAAPAGRPRRSA